MEAGNGGGGERWRRGTVEAGNGGGGERWRRGTMEAGNGGGGERCSLSVIAAVTVLNHLVRAVDARGLGRGGRPIPKCRRYVIQADESFHANGVAPPATAPGKDDVVAACSGRGGWVRRRRGGGDGWWRECACLGRCIPGVVLEATFMGRLGTSWKT